MKKLLSVLLAAVLCAGLCVPAFADLVRFDFNPFEIFNSIKDRYNNAATVINEDGAAAKDTNTGEELTVPYGTEIVVKNYEVNEDGSVTIVFGFDGRECCADKNDFSGPGIVAIDDSIGEDVSISERISAFFAKKVKPFFDGIKTFIEVFLEGLGAKAKSVFG